MHYILHYDNSLNLNNLFDYNRNLFIDHSINKHLNRDLD